MATRLTNSELSNLPTTTESHEAWHLLALLLTIGRPTRSAQLASKCTLFRASPELVEFLCCIPNSPLFLTKDLLVTISSVGLSAFGRFVLNSYAISSFVPQFEMDRSGPSSSWDGGSGMYCRKRKLTMSDFDFMPMAKKRLILASADAEEEYRMLLSSWSRLQNAYAKAHFKWNDVRRRLNTHLGYMEDSRYLHRSMLITPFLVNLRSGSHGLQNTKHAEGEMETNGPECQHSFLKTETSSNVPKLLTLERVMTCEPDSEPALLTSLLENQVEWKGARVDELDLGSMANFVSSLFQEVDTQKNSGCEVTNAAIVESERIMEGSNGSLMSYEPDLGSALLTSILDQVEWGEQDEINLRNIANFYSISFQEDTQGYISELQVGNLNSGCIPTNVTVVESERIIECMKEESLPDIGSIKREDGNFVSTYNTPQMDVLAKNDPEGANLVNCKDMMPSFIKEPKTELPVAPKQATVPTELPVAPKQAAVPTELPVAPKQATVPTELPVAPKQAAVPTELPVAPKQATVSPVAPKQVKRSSPRLQAACKSLESDTAVQALKKQQKSRRDCKSISKMQKVKHNHSDYMHIKHVEGEKETNGSECQHSFLNNETTLNMPNPIEGIMAFAPDMESASLITILENQVKCEEAKLDEIKLRSVVNFDSTSFQVEDKLGSVSSLLDGNHNSGYKTTNVTIVKSERIMEGKKEESLTDTCSLKREVENSVPTYNTRLRASCKSLKSDMAVQVTKKQQKCRRGQKSISKKQKLKQNECEPSQHVEGEKEPNGPECQHSFLNTETSSNMPKLMACELGPKSTLLINTLENQVQLKEAKRDEINPRSMANVESNMGVQAPQKQHKCRRGHKSISKKQKLKQNQCDEMHIKHVEGEKETSGPESQHSFHKTETSPNMAKLMACEPDPESKTLENQVHCKEAKMDEINLRTVANVESDMAIQDPQKQQKCRKGHKSISKKQKLKQNQCDDMHIKHVKGEKDTSGPECQHNFLNTKTSPYMSKLIAGEPDLESTLLINTLENQIQCKEAKVDKINLRRMENVQSSPFQEVDKDGIMPLKTANLNFGCKATEMHTVENEKITEVKKEERLTDSGIPKREDENFVLTCDAAAAANVDMLPKNESGGVNLVNCNDMMPSLNKETKIVHQESQNVFPAKLLIAPRQFKQPSPKRKAIRGAVLSPRLQAACKALDYDKDGKTPKELQKFRRDHKSISTKQTLKQNHHAEMHIKDKRENSFSISSKDQLEPKILPKFESFIVEEEEGAGGYGIVYRARRKNDGVMLAVKCPHANAHKHHINNELKMLERFGGKPFIIKFEGSFKSKDAECFVLQHVEHDRPEVLKREIGVFQLRWYGFCLLRALSTLHKQGVVHRDVKPGNFLFSRKDNKGYLIDFNLAMDLHQKYGTANKTKKFTSTKFSEAFDKELVSSKQALESKTLKRKAMDQTKPYTELGSRKAIKTQAADGSGITSARDMTSTRTPSGERMREPLPFQGRKELLCLAQEAMQVPNDGAVSSITESKRKRVTAVPEKVDKKLICVTPMPLRSTGAPVAGAGLVKTKGDGKQKREGPCVGTKGFRAPEVLFRSPHQGPKVDIWSAGVTLLYLVVGRMPFGGDPEENIKDIAKLRGSEDLWEVAKIHNREASFPEDLFDIQTLPSKKLSDWCKSTMKRPDFFDELPRSLFDLLNKCLTVNPRLRISADEALNHEFFSPCHEALRKQRLLRQKHSFSDHLSQGQNVTGAAAEVSH